MLDATALGTMKYYIKQCAHGESNNDLAWGGIPIIILVGDDYQLPPISYGAIYALHPEEIEKGHIKNAVQMAMHGFSISRVVSKCSFWLLNQNQN